MLLVINDLNIAILFLKDTFFFFLPLFKRINEKEPQKIG